MLSEVERIVSRLGPVLAQDELDTLANTMLREWVDRDGTMGQRQVRLRERLHEDNRAKYLETLASVSVDKRQERYRERESRSRRRDEEKADRRARKRAKERTNPLQRKARRDRLQELALESEDWDYAG